MITTTIRINATLYDKICKEAMKQDRSINSQICFILNQYISSLIWQNKK